MTYPVNSDGPRKPINSLAEELRGKKENTTLPLLVEPSRRGTPDKGDLIQQDTIIVSNLGVYQGGKLKSLHNDIASELSVRQAREMVLDFIGDQLDRKDLEDWSAEFEMRAKEK